ncbi:MAG: hypothetical protein ACREPV_01230 [Lysobacter sp.]
MPVTGRAHLIRRMAAAAAGLLFASALFAGAALAGPPPVPESIWKLLIVGIPLSVLAASLAGRTVRYLGEPAQPDTKIPAKVAGIIADGFIGGWLAMLVVGLPITQAHLGSVLPEVLGALLALSVQWLRDNLSRYVDQAFQAVLSWWTRKRSPGPAERGDL